MTLIIARIVNGWEAVVSATASRTRACAIPGMAVDTPIDQKMFRTQTLLHLAYFINVGWDNRHHTETVDMDGRDLRAIVSTDLNRNQRNHHVPSVS